MDAYEASWRKVARSTSWSVLTERYSWVLFKAETNRLRRERDARWAKEREEKLARKRRTEVLEPVCDWFGAAWLSPEGKFYPVLFGNHTERARQIGNHLFPEIAAKAVEEQGYFCAEDYLSDHGWLRVGTDGLVSDAYWTRQKHHTDAQYGALWAMLERGKAHKCSHELATYQYDEFLDGLEISIQYCDGKVDRWGDPIEEREEVEVNA